MHKYCYTASDDQDEQVNKLRLKNSFICTFRNATEMDCICKYYSKETNKTEHQQYIYVGDELYNWYQKHNFSLIRVGFSSSLSPKIKTFNDLFRHCDEIKKTMRNDKSLQCNFAIDNPVYVTCSCLRGFSDSDSSLYIFKFHDVFTNQSECIFSNRTATGCSPPPIIANISQCETINPFLQSCTISSEKKLNSIFLPLSFFFLIFAFLAIWLYKDFQNYRRRPSSVDVDIDLI